MILTQEGVDTLRNFVLAIEYHRTSDLLSGFESERRTGLRVLREYESTAQTQVALTDPLNLRFNLIFWFGL